LLIAAAALSAAGCSLDNKNSNNYTPENIAEITGASDLSPAAEVNEAAEMEESPTRRIGVDVLYDDYYSGLCSVPDSAYNDELLNGGSMRYITITSDTLLPKYYDGLDELVFPRALTKGIKLFSLKNGGEINFNAMDSLNLKALRDASASVLGFEAYSDRLVCESYYNSAAEYLTDETDWSVLSTALKESILLKFYNTAYGLRIVDPWYTQGLWVNCSGNNVTMYAGRASDYYNTINEFAPADDQFVKAMPLLDALKIADGTRTKNRNLTKAELVYICLPEIFGDEEYHFCWEITMRYTTYYINCVTGQKWYDTKQED
jgi:hypothetical protein